MPANDRRDLIRRLNVKIINLEIRGREEIWKSNEQVPYEVRTHYRLS